MLKQKPITVTKPLIPRQKVQKLMTEIGGAWYMEKIAKELITLRRPKLSKNHKRRRIKLKNHMRIIGIGMIENSNQICTSLNGSIQEVKSKGEKPIQFL